MNVRCKFRCDAVRKSAHWDKEKGFLYETSFLAVHDGSPENEKFFEATPSGNLKIGVHKEDVFEVGKEYYIDISPAE